MKRLVGKLSSRSITALKNVGILLFEWKKFEESLKVFEKCVKRMEEIEPEAENRDEGYSQCAKYLELCKQEVEKL